MENEQKYLCDFQKKRVLTNVISMNLLNFSAFRLVLILFYKARE